MWGIEAWREGIREAADDIYSRPMRAVIERWYWQEDGEQAGLEVVTGRENVDVGDRDRQKGNRECINMGD